MVSWRLPPAQVDMVKLLPLGVLALGVLFLGLAMMATREGAGAIAPCVPHTLTAEEQQFLQALQAWRDQNIPGSHPLVVVPELNAAAYGYAQYVAQTPGAAGHYADGADWVRRANNCGFFSRSDGATAGGEGIAQVQGSGEVALTPSQALAIMESHQGSGIWIPANVGLPVKCVGIGKATSAAGNKVVWIVKLFAIQGECPSAPPTVLPTSIPTASPTPSPTASPSPTPSPSPTSPGWEIVAPGASRE